MVPTVKVVLTLTSSIALDHSEVTNATFTKAAFEYLSLCNGQAK
ncbi:Uncharacterised protein [Mycobacterium tuberculosis]|nr:Uncharacterised protein [Mycobacterium tuberculosis]